MSGIPNLGKLVVHLGLPKTGTTTLQTDVFPEIPRRFSKAAYLGVRQPRSAQQHPLFQSLSAAVQRGGDAIEIANRQLQEYLASCELAIVSEEMFTASGGTCWRERISNLGETLEGLDYEVMLTIRDPVAASFSYYVECYTQFRHWTCFSECVARDKAMRIYHYPTLLQQLSTVFDDSKLRVWRFEDLARDGFHAVASPYLTASELRAAKWNVEHHNRRSKEREGITIVKPINVLDEIVTALTNGSTLGRRGVQLLKKLVPIQVRRSLRKPFVAEKAFIVPSPNAEEMSAVRQLLGSEATVFDRYVLPTSELAAS